MISRCNLQLPIYLINSHSSHNSFANQLAEYRKDD